MRQGYRQFDVLIQWNFKGLYRPAIHRDLQRRGDRILRCCSHIFDAQSQCHGFANNSEGGGIPDAQASVPVVLFSGEQKVHRCRQVNWQIRVVNLTVRQSDDPGDPRAGFFGQGLGQSCHQFRATITIAVWNGDAAHFGVGAISDACGQSVGGGFRLIRPVG